MEGKHGFEVVATADQVTLTNTKTKESVLVSLVEGGATLQITLLSADNHPVDTIQHEGVRFPSSMMLPWPNRIKDGKYIFNDKEYHTAINEEDRNNSLHGLLFNRRMKLKNQVVTVHHVEVTLTYDFDGKDEGYPFLLYVDLVFRLFDNRQGFECEVVAVNKGNEDLPFAVGWHPYWRVTKRSGQVIHDLINTQTLQIASTGETFVVDDRLIPIGTAPFEGLNSVLGETFFDTGYWLKETPSAHRGGKPVYETRLKNPQEGLELVLWQESEHYPYVQVYTPPARSSIAIEPMSHRTNAFNSTGGIVLKSGAQNEFRAKYGAYLV